ncbi:glycosyltransferase [Corynebacterium hadale]|uniref:glycosyltransferase n=1 Tax=Corynebacterium hadale TaxID=2026255 RepID=UPI0013FD136E|nr:glycosyltransferase [Corynebacterium hadale]
MFEPKSPSWRLSRSLGRKDEEKYFSRLFSDERMEARSEIFFEHSLPSIDKAANQHDIKHVVSFSEELPDIYKDRLAEAQRSYSWLILDERTAVNRKGMPLGELSKELYRTGTVFAEYRLDDDDILAGSYFDQLEEYLRPELVGYYVSLGLGVQALFDGGVFYAPRVEHRPKIAIGLARICAYSEDSKLLCPPRVAHTRVDLNAPTIIDSRQLSFLHSLHLNQDSGEQKPEDDLGNRLRNYIRQPKIVAGEEDLSMSFPTAVFKEDDLAQLSRELRAELTTRRGLKSLITRIYREAVQR